jgi:hypothetical protein
VANILEASSTLKLLDDEKWRVFAGGRVARLHGAMLPYKREMSQPSRKRGSFPVLYVEYSDGRHGESKLSSQPCTRKLTGRFARAFHHDRSTVCKLDEMHPRAPSSGLLCESCHTPVNAGAPGRRGEREVAEWHGQQSWISHVVRVKRLGRNLNHCGLSVHSNEISQAVASHHHADTVVATVLDCALDCAEVRRLILSCGL